CALFSTFSLAYGSDVYTDSHVQKSLQYTRYSENHIWVIPIHRPSSEHWVLCIVYLDSGRIHHFDSL
ncbi:hypothetical protein BJ165DRAFT_1316976, partial [Panaeolus papilionaceus]